MPDYSQRLVWPFSVTIDDLPMTRACLFQARVPDRDPWSGRVVRAWNPRVRSPSCCDWQIVTCATLEDTQRGAPVTLSLFNLSSYFSFFSFFYFLQLSSSHVDPCSFSTYVRPKRLGHHLSEFTSSDGVRYFVWLRFSDITPVSIRCNLE